MLKIIKLLDMSVSKKNKNNDEIIKFDISNNNNKLSQY